MFLLEIHNPERGEGLPLETELRHSARLTVLPSYENKYLYVIIFTHLWQTGMGKENSK